MSSDKRLVVLTSHWEGVRWEFGQAFARWTRDRYGKAVGVEWMDLGGTSDAVKFVRSEFARKNSGIGIDLFFGGGIEAHMLLARKGLSQAMELPQRLADALPMTAQGMRLRDPKGRWFGAALGGFGIVYNRPVLRRLKLPVPRTWEDLAHPRMHTWVGSGDPRSSGSMHMVFEIILQAYGFEQGYSVAVRMGANVRTFTRSSADIPRETALGEVACGTALDSYAGSQMARVGKHRLGFVLPERLTVINPDGISVLKGAPHPTWARRFVLFVLGRAGQLLWMLPKGAPQGPTRFTLARMASRPDIYPELAGKALAENPFARKKAFPYDERKAARRWAPLNALLGACLIDTHQQLRRAFKAVVDNGADPRDLEKLTALPMNERQLEALGLVWEKDPAVGSLWRSRWVRQCRSRYESLIEAMARRGSGCCR